MTRHQRCTNSLHGLYRKAPGTVVEPIYRGPSARATIVQRETCSWAVLAEADWGSASYSEKYPSLGQAMRRRRDEQYHNTAGQGEKGPDINADHGCRHRQRSGPAVRRALLYTATADDIVNPQIAPTPNTSQSKSSYIHHKILESPTPQPLLRCLGVRELPTTIHSIIAVDAAR